jgi:KDO2-lipid IV(A) lauroyltransferase
LYYIVYGLFYGLSLLPIRVLYALGDFIRWVLFELIGYRNDVVMQNLRQSFPEKTEAECRKITRQFQQNFIDTWIETIKFFSISPRRLKKMVEVSDSELVAFRELNAQGKSCQLMSGHFMNWELLPNALPVMQPLTLVGIYMPLSSKVMNQVFIKFRSRRGTKLVSAANVKQELQQYSHIPIMFAMGADQNPAVAEKACWLKFLNQPTAFPKGPSKYACANNLPVYFSWLEKVKRGQYKMHFELMTEAPALLGEAALTLLYARKVEAVINKHPDNYLWSHRRWKHKWKEAYQPNWIDTTDPVTSGL